jgi:hypothetical protein
LLQNQLLQTKKQLFTRERIVSAEEFIEYFVRIAAKRVRIAPVRLVNWHAVFETLLAESIVNGFALSFEIAKKN